MTNLNVQGLNKLVFLDCSTNLLSNLNVSNNYNLETIVCNLNQLTTLNLTSLSNLTNLNCAQNQLTVLDITGNSNLAYFNCCVNEITFLFIKNGVAFYLDFEFSDNPNLKYICCDENQINNIQQKVNQYGYSNCQVNKYCSFVPGGTYFTIQGNSILDNNNNGCDVNDGFFPNLQLKDTNSTGDIIGSYISNTTGNYSIPVQAGTHIMTPIIENPGYFNVSSSNTSIEFPAETSPFILDFCITVNGVHPDVEVTLLPTIPARPGFDATYKIIYKNKGTTSQSGSVNFIFNDAVLDFVSASPSTTNQSINILSWDYTNLLPFENREITLTLNVNSPMETPAVNIGDQLNFRAEVNPITGDETPYDNVSAIKQIVVGSFDPNDKTCLEGTTITPAMVGEYVHYIIRFENTGTFPAENIVVKDMIDLAKFDINTLVPIKGSHEFVTNITSGNKVEFIFENINLPFDDANNDGFVAFKIKTKSSLVLGDTFTNSANIYFDYNFPIVTNTATTTVQTLGKQDFDFAKYFTVYPNPASSTLNLSVKSGIVVNSIAIPNAQSVANIDVSNLKTGNYFIKMITDKGTSNTKFIKN